MELIFEKIKGFVKNELDGLCSAHDFYHIERVFSIALKIQKEEKSGDEIIVGVGALLHEMLDEKFFDKESLKKQKSKINTLLENLVSAEQKNKITYIIENIGFGKSLSGKNIDKFIEFQIIEDADRLESIGAIAIARCFTYGGKIKRPIYDPNIKPKLNLTKEQYDTYNSSSINHFYEKLLKLKDLINTNSAKKIAENKHKYMEDFLKRFMDEWDGII